VRFIGSKESLLPHIENIIRENVEDDDSLVAGDVFSGSGAVSRHFKKLGFRVIANDNLRFCVSLACAVLKNNEEPKFRALFEEGKSMLSQNFELFPFAYDRVLNYLNQLPGEEGFIYRNYTPGGTTEGPYPRQYFSDENGKKIDAVRRKIDHWKEKNLITEAEECLLLADLLEATNRIANISGTYGCFNKKWDKRAVKKLKLERSEITIGKDDHEWFSMDANTLVTQKKFDILYLDPPYTWRHYGAYYHILETIVKNDEPNISGKTGLRPWEDSRSRYCDRKDALNALRELIASANARHILLSYNSEGLIQHEEIIEALATRGAPICKEIPYRRYRSNSGGNTSNTVKERLYYVKVS
jgi:adenine-specific DNA-methyltransferase